ncbi:hypothetical protein J4E81_004400 [Alternaria sp. BMP 2799]|nr:hypothetical protein J4E81_004400 [Alternaria sp. BMP 2799]
MKVTDKVRDLGKEMVRVTVGTSKTPFTFHKKLLRRESEYFSRAFGPNFKEGKDGVLHLPETSKTTFRLFQTWVYLQTTRSPPGLSEVEALLSPAARMTRSLNADVSAHTRTRMEETNQNRSDADSDCNNDVLNSLFHLYRFADAYECVKLRNDVISAFSDLTKDGLAPDPETIAFMFEELPPSSTICQYFVKSAALNWGHYRGPYRALLEATPLPQDFLVEVVRINHKLASKGKGMDALCNEIQDRCNFHEHATEDEKELCKSRMLQDAPYIDALILACLEISKGDQTT